MTRNEARLLGATATATAIETAPPRVAVPRPVRRRAVAPLAPPRPVETGAWQSTLLLATLAFQCTALLMALLTAASMALLGPFGFLPALTIGPLVLLAELTGWLAEPSGRAKREAAPPAEAPAPIEPERIEREPVSWVPARPTLRTSLRRGLTEVARVHHTLPTLLGALEAEHEPLRQLLHLQALRRHLEDHFRAEEAPLGLFEELKTVDPRAEDDLGRLCDEHQEILDDLTALTEISALEDPAAASELPSQAQVLERIRNHQRNEDALVQQVYGFRVEGELGA